MIKSSADSCTECGSVLRGTEKFCPSCGNRVSTDDTSDEIVLDVTLPISLEYTEAIKININNPSTVKISKADLEFYPYYVIEYKIDIQRIDPSGKKHSLAKIWNRHKRTIAVCEICGRAFCNDHIFRINQVYYCKDHLSS